MRWRRAASTSRGGFALRSSRAPASIALLVGGAIAVGAATLADAAAAADDCTPRAGISGCVDADELWSRPGASPYAALGPGITTPRGRVSFGVAVSYAKRPIVAQAAAASPDGRSVALVDDLLDGTFLFGVGVTDRLELTLSAPVAFYEDGAGAGFFTGSGAGLPRSSARDGRFGFAYAFVAHPRDEHAKKVSLSLIGRFEVGAPYGSGAAFSRARTATLAPAVTGDLRAGRFDVSAELGARVRGESAFLDETWGSQLAFALGASARVWDLPRLTVGAEAFATPGLSTQPNGSVLTPAEWMIDVSAAPFLGGDVVFGVSGGGAIPTASSATASGASGLERALTAPLYRFGATIRYAPAGRPSPPPPSSPSQ